MRRHSDTDAERDTNNHRDTDADVDSYPHDYGNTNGDGHANAYAECDTHCDEYRCNCDAHTYADFDAPVLLEARLHRLHGRWWGNECR